MKAKIDPIWIFLTGLCSLILTTTVVYYLYAITPTISIILLILFLLAIYKLRKKIFNGKWSIINDQWSLSLISFLIVEIVLFATLITSRTTELMPSPWQAVGPWFFILYAIATGLLFFNVWKSKQTGTGIILTSLHLFLTYSVTVILYPLGWGFDAFIHRATEVWIQNNGFVLPKTPYYIGQYSFVVWLSNITRIPIFFIDIYLVPLLTSTTLPAVISSSLKRIWNIPIKYSLLLVWLIPFITFFDFNLTTPHNVVLLLSIIIVFAVLTFLKDQLHWSVPFIIATTAAATHPLIGGPIFLFTVSAILYKKIKKYNWFYLILSGILVSISLPVMFIINNLRSGTGWPKIINPLDQLDHFFALFARPYWYLENAPLVFEILYTWQRLIVPVLILLSVAGIYLLARQNKVVSLSSARSGVWLLVTGFLSFLISGWLLRSWLVFPDVVSYEQGDFPLRIIKASLIFILPLAMYGLYKIFAHTEKKKFLLAVLCSLFSLLLMLSFYLSYPQRNIKARFPGLNITQSDFKAVEWINNRHNQYDYVVLSNQLVSAAALTNYSFAKYFDTPEGPVFYYSVPTGGEQYKQYGRMLYEGQKKEYMEVAMDRVGVDTGYFVVNRYWANSDEIIEGAKKTATVWHVIDSGEVWVFIYDRTAG